MSARRAAPLALLALILLIAAALRLRQLDARGLWFDEGVSLTFSQMAPADVLRYHRLWEDTNPPAYRILLGWWTRGAGAGPFSARVFSALPGVLAVALTYRIGRRLRLEPAAGVAAAAWLAVSPMQVYYSREVKHYQLVQLALLTAIALGLHLLIVMASRPSGRARSGVLLALAAALSGCTALAVGSHYMALLLLFCLDAAALALALAALRRGRGWRAIGPPLAVWAGGQFIGAAVWLPWVLATAPAAAAGTRSAAANVGLLPRTPLAFLAESVAEFAAGPAASPAAAGLAGAALIGLLAAGLVLPGAPRRARRLLLLWALGPLLLGMVVQFFLPFFFARFLLYVTPALALLAGAGLVHLVRSPSLGRPAASAAALALIAVSVWQVRAQAALPQPSPDLRPAAADLTTSLQPGDALIYSYSWQPGMLSAYLPPGRAPVYYSSFFAPGERDPSLARILERHGRAWLLTYRIAAEDPINDVGRWLLLNAPSAAPSWYGESQLTLFVDPARLDNPGPPQKCAAFDSGRIALCYAPLQASRSSISPPPVIALALQWRLSGPLDAPYVVFVHVTAGADQAPVAQLDAPPAAGWRTGGPIRDLRALVLPSDIAAGEYQVLVGLYDPVALSRLPVEGGGDAVRIGQIRVLSGP